MQVIKIGGPVYRIGVGGGAASSVMVLFTIVILILFSIKNNTDIIMIC
jgi:hypothetical protein